MQTINFLAGENYVERLITGFVRKSAKIFSQKDTYSPW